MRKALLVEGGHLQGACRKAVLLIVKNHRLMIVDTIEVLLYSKRVSGCQGDSYLSMGAYMDTIKLAMAGT